MNARTIREGIVPSAIGLLAAILLHQAGGWWLNSGRGVLTAMATLFGTALGVCLPSDVPWRRATAICIGSIAGMAATLFWIGPGTIWPIVLVVAAALTCVAVFAGAAVARLVRHRR